MNDMTRGPVAGHVVRLAGFIAVSTAFQSLYYLADLYFVGRLGKEAVAGVSLAGTLMFVVLALTQSLGAGATSLVAQALGRKDRDRAERIFNQALVLGNIAGLLFGIVAFTLHEAYSNWLAADPQTAAQGIAYLRWFIPAMCLQFPMVAIGSALRGMGDMKVPTLISVITVVTNIVLAPMLMFGTLGLPPMGVAGTALASLIAIGGGCIALAAHFARASNPLKFRRDQWDPDLLLWRDILKIGVPAGGEFALMSVYVMLVYDIIRPFGAAAQAGFGIGARLTQALFLPTVAIAFATGPVVGQNFGARLGDRVRRGFYAGASMSASLMIILALVCQFVPEAMLRFFNDDPTVVAYGSEYLRVISFNFVFSGIIFVSSSVFQGMGHTLPSLASSALRLVLFVIPAYVLSHRPGFALVQVWWTGVASIAMQFAVNMALLHREFRRKLRFEGVPATNAAGSAPVATFE